MVFSGSRDGTEPICAPCKQRSLSDLRNGERVPRGGSGAIETSHIHLVGFGVLSPPSNLHPPLGVHA